MRKYATQLVACGQPQRRLSHVRPTQDDRLVHFWLLQTPTVTTPSGPVGNRLSAIEGTGRTLNWNYDGIYRLTNETVSSDPAKANVQISYTLDCPEQRLLETRPWDSSFEGSLAAHRLTGLENNMTIQGATVHVLSLLTVVAIWIAQPDAGLAECDNDLLHFPVSLKLGLVKTPEFTTRSGGVNAIEITARNVLPAADLSCMMGLSEGQQDPLDCNKEPLIEASWKVRSGGKIVAQGSSRDMGKRGYYQGNLYGKYIGVFKARKHEKYSLEVDFTKDGSALAPAEPHLIVSDFLPSTITDPKPDHETLYTTNLPLAPGHFRSHEFEGHKGLNVISFRVLGRLAMAKEFCLFGIQTFDFPKCAEESVVDFEWTLWSEGKTVASGTSHPHEGNKEAFMYSGPIDHCGGTEFIERDVGFFNGRKGQRFSIEVNIKKDGSELTIAYPTLSIVKGYPPSAFAM